MGRGWEDVAAARPFANANSRGSINVARAICVVLAIVLIESAGNTHLHTTYEDAEYKEAHVPRIEVHYNASIEKGVKCCTKHRTGSRAVNDCVRTPYHGHLVRDDKVKHSGHPGTTYDCTVSHKHKFIFPHIYKSGGSSLKNWFVSVLCDGVVKKRGDRHPTANQACPHDILYHGSCNELAQHPDYFAFAFVRHPVNRTISQYGMMTHRNFWTGGEKPTLESFVKTPLIAARGSRLAHGHFHKQYDFVFNRQGCPVVDFIGHLETYERDFYFVLGKLDAPELWEGFANYSFYGHRGADPNVFGTNLRKELKEALVFTKEMEDVIYERMPRDYEWLGYERAFG